ncbi:MAG: hypothetical protein NC206_04505 [Bacteroides sp.]|nr:hypothetical protein [Roseburia sp.]MCM1346325.1 hypothetical protein [Bacteroides sp.]MCM1420914.1 hypothetical protein [Bacteroides sp.]
MNTKYMISMAALALVCTDAAAQMDNVVEVENSYVPVVKDANKINVVPETSDTPVKHYNVEYATNSLPVHAYMFQPVWAAQSDAAVKGAKKGFVSLAGGNGGNVSARGAYGMEFTSDDLLNVDISLDGHNGNVDGDDDWGTEWKSRFYSTRASVGYEHKLTSVSSVVANVEFESQVFNYRPEAFTGGLVGSAFACDKQHNTLGGVSVGVTPYAFDKFSVGGELGYSFFSQKYATSLDDECKEGIFSGRLNVGYNIDTDRKIGVEVMWRSAMYDMKYNDLSFAGSNDFKSNTSFHLSPAYDMRCNDLDLHIGVQLCGTSGVRSKFRVAPDIRLRHRISKQVDVYAEATGGEVYNDFRHFSQLTPYWGFLNGAAVDADMAWQLPNQFDLLCATAGLRVELAKGLLADIHAGYDISKDRAELLGGYSYVSMDMGGVSPLFAADGNHLRLNIDLRYDYKDILSVNMKNCLNNWESVDSPFSDEKLTVCWRPVVDLDWMASLRVIPELQIGLGYKLQTFKKPDTETDGKKRPTTSNLCADLSYTFNSGLSLFVRGDNLLNESYENFWGYRALGTNVLAGFAWTF